MRSFVRWVALAIAFPAGGALAESPDVLTLSRLSTVKVISPQRGSAGSGALIGAQHVLTCFHVVAGASGGDGAWAFHPDLRVELPSGELIDGHVVSVPTRTDGRPGLLPLS